MYLDKECNFIMSIKIVLVFSCGFLLSLSIYTEYWKLNMKLKILLLVVFIYYHKRAMLTFSRFWKTIRKTATMPSSCQFISKSFCVIYLGGLLTVQKHFLFPREHCAHYAWAQCYNCCISDLVKIERLFSHPLNYVFSLSHLSTAQCCPERAVLTQFPGLAFRTELRRENFRY